MTTQTQLRSNVEAEQLANSLEHWAKDYATTDFDCEMGEQAASELRRLVSFNQQLMDDVARLQNAVAEEREACAKLVDYWEARQGEHSDAIRARGNVT
jgi:hypothetical protein